MAYDVYIVEVVERSDNLAHGARLSDLKSDFSLPKLISTSIHYILSTLLLNTLKKMFSRAINTNLASF